MASLSSPHFVLFPFMSKGHTIPLLQLARLLHLRRGVRITIITTQSNSPFIRHSLSDIETSIILLPFPQNIAGLPPGVESTDQLPSISLFLPFATSTKPLQPHFEQILQTLSHVTCIISDGFLGWTLESAKKFGIPRLVSYGMTSYPMVMRRAAIREYPNIGINSTLDEPLTLKSFPGIKISQSELGQNLGPGPLSEFVNEQVKATSNSWGIVFNTFQELEHVYVDYWNREYKPKAWCLGPLCLTEPPRVHPHKPIWLQWLDDKRSVLYVAFGSQVDVPLEQLKEIEIGLERSKVNFLWVMRSKGPEIEEEIGKRVKDRGLVVREWVNQSEILRHESVTGFMSHCGWNSVLESICSSVPILAWPMMADQFFNAKLVVEELGIGLRIGGGGFVESERVEKMVRELMVGDGGIEAMKKVKKISQAARMATEEGGSSWRSLDTLIHEVCILQRERERVGSKSITAVAL